MDYLCPYLISFPILAVPTVLFVVHQTRELCSRKPTEFSRYCNYSNNNNSYKITSLGV